MGEGKLLQRPVPGPQIPDPGPRTPNHPPPRCSPTQRPPSPSQPACAGCWALYPSTTSLLGAEWYMVAPCAGGTSGGASCHLPTRPSVAPSGQQSLPTCDFPQLRPLRVLPPLRARPGGQWGGLGWEVVQSPSPQSASSVPSSVLL